MIENISHITHTTEPEIRESIKTSSLSQKKFIAGAEVYHYVKKFLLGEEGIRPYCCKELLKVCLMT